MKRTVWTMALMVVVAACSGITEPSSTGDTTVTTPAVTSTTTTLPSTTSTTPETTAPAATTPETTVSDTTTPETTATTAPGTPEIADGREFAYVTAVTVTGKETVVTADYAQFLTGEEADRAAREAGVIGEGESVPNDFFIVNQNPRLRSIPLAADAPIAVQACFVDGECVTTVEVSVDQWVALVTGRQPDDLPEGFQWYGQGTLPYWLTIENGVIVDVEEQYLP